MHSILNRSETVEKLIARDGSGCRWINCNFNIDVKNPITIEHIIPRSKGGTDELFNLELLCQTHNYYRANRDYENYELRILVPIVKNTKPQKTKHKTPSSCCNEGRNLGPDEVCSTCGAFPQPYTFPKWAQRELKDCDHSFYHCKWCVIGHYERKPAFRDVF